MACYIIDYDLRADKDYTKLYEAIKSFEKWAHILESSWGIVTSKTAKEVRNYLLGYMDSDDGLIVVKTCGEAAWHEVKCKDEWLKENI